MENPPLVQTQTNEESSLGGVQTRMTPNPATILIMRKVR
jgi:hypothetical protein